MNEKDIADELFQRQSSPEEPSFIKKLYPLSSTKVNQLISTPGAVIDSRNFSGPQNLDSTSGIGVEIDELTGDQQVNAIAEDSETGYSFHLIKTEKALELIDISQYDGDLYPVLAHENSDSEEGFPGVLVWVEIWDAAAEFPITPDKDPVEILESLDRNILNASPAGNPDAIEISQSKLVSTRQIFGILNQLALDHNLDAADEALKEIYPAVENPDIEEFFLKDLEDYSFNWTEVGIPSYLKAKSVAERLGGLIGDFRNNSSDYLINDFFVQVLKVDPEQSGGIDYIDRIFQVLQYLFMKTSLMSEEVQRELFEDILFFVLVEDIKILPDAYTLLGNLVDGILNSDRRAEIERAVEGLNEADPNEARVQTVCFKILAIA